MKASPAQRLYKVALHLYPPSFYHQFAGDMLMDFRDSHAVMRARGPWLLASYLVHAYVDLAATVMAQWSRVDSVRIAICTASGNLGLWTAAFWIASREWPHGPVTSASLLQLFFD